MNGVTITADLVTALPVDITVTGVRRTEDSVSGEPTGYDDIRITLGDIDITPAVLDEMREAAVAALEDAAWDEVQ